MWRSDPRSITQRGVTTTPITVPLHLVALVLALTMNACGSSSPTTPSTPRVSGAWIGHATLTAVSGGECVGAALQATPGSRDTFSARVQQWETELAASVTYQGNATSCVFRGTADGSSVDFSLSSCPAGRKEAFVCAGGLVRDLEIVAARVTARNTGGTGRGTDTTTWNVFARGSTTPLSTLMVTAEFIWNVLGIPHDDFHIFDGSVLPGYVDGVVIIPEEPNPFCTRCGWF